MSARLGGASDNSQGHILGALACMDALRRARATVKGERGQTIPQFFECSDVAIAILMETAGPLTPRAAGVLHTLVCILVDNLQNGYGVDECLDSTWTPESTMTAEQIEIARAEFLAESVARNN